MAVKIYPVQKTIGAECGYRVRINGEEVALDAEYISCREELRLAGLREEDLRNMEPDARVALLEQARLDPYDYIYLAC